MNRTIWIIIVAVAVFYFSRNFHGGRSDTVEYRGESFHMSRAYSSYEDYKDDPNNLATNELARIERAITNAPLSSPIHSEGDVALAVLRLRFPGYGCGGAGAYPQSDGTACGLYFVEIPMLDRNRYFLDHTSGGQTTVVDDFVMSTTNEIKNVKIEGAHVLYYDQRGALLRDKQM
jgi:hypothetical protein